MLLLISSISSVISAAILGSECIQRSAGSASSKISNVKGAINRAINTPADIVRGTYTFLAMATSGLNSKAINAEKNSGMRSDFAKYNV